MQTHHKLMIMAIIFSLILLAFGQKCHAVQLLDDFAGLRKSVNQGPIWAPDPSRLFATPGGAGHQVGATSMPAVRADNSRAEVKPEPKPETKPDVKPEEKPKPPCPKPPIVKPPKDEPKHKCWPFKFRAPKAKPECKPDAKHDKKPSCRKADHKKSVCSKPAKSGNKMGCKGPGVAGHGFGHSKGDGRKGGHGQGNGHGHGCGRR